ncbi:RCC1 domain-containing protein [Silvanigrella aquatica]|uniref:Chromosome condensation regulator RCC1 n=1 Tax=Silvanigrella aquatica TaxID=1915309 RepID=A0A1L4CZA9_9BACT|nr:hypothetical protein [Silvanigrella aquatica]APJ03286.1 hypothetical protein AXG55_04965 [Silvanigrella aquatica]
MKKSNFIWLLFLTPIYYFHSCTPSRNLPDPPMKLEQTLSSDVPLKNLAISSLTTGKVNQYTTHGAKNGLISLGDANGCVVMVRGELKCWGENSNSQLGLNSMLGSKVPTPTMATAVNPKNGEDMIISVVMGRTSTCAKYAKGGYKCWGNQASGVLGNGQTVGNAVAPKQVTNATGLVLKSVQLNDGYSCVLDEGGKVTCWGKNDKGQLGNGNNVNSYAGTEVSLGGVAATQLVSHNYNSCALLLGSEVKCWGEDFSSIPPYTPVSVTTRSPVVLLGGGTSADLVLICAVLQDTTVQCFGKSPNTFGEFGNGNFNLPSSSTIGETVITADGNPLTDVTMIGSGGARSTSKPLPNGINQLSFACAVVSNSSVYCWGGNDSGNLGNNSFEDSNFAVKVTQMWQNSDILDLAVSDARACVLLKNDDVWCWGGKSSNGELGNGDLSGQSSIPVKILNRNDH